ncbi:MAG: methylmalonyl-CoA mutase family protein [Geminicoccaceae bacterium]
MTDTGKAKIERDRPWLFRTYAGHSSAAASNDLYRTNLARGQTGLSVAFDLPTQTGYDSDHPLAKGEVGKVGVPISSIADMEVLFENIPLDAMNTSMTINATAPWLLALYVVTAERQGVDRRSLSGTVQNDLIKEYLSRGTYIFPPEPSLALTRDIVTFTYKDIPKWNPTNVCSYHLQEAGATPVQEVAFALANAMAVLDEVKASGQIDAADLPGVVGRISFFVNAGVRFVTEICKMRAFAELWDDICSSRYGVDDQKLRRFRYGVQVNSLGLTEQQPENNVYRILLETLAVTLSKSARARAVQLPAWNEALGLPRPFDQQWSLRLQQILAYETDLLEYGDLFDGSPVISAKVDEVKNEVRAELDRIDQIGGVLPAIESGYMKEQLVQSNTARLAAIASGAQKVVGVNCFTESAPSPLTAEGDDGFMTVSAEAEAEQIARLDAHRAARNDEEVRSSLDALRRAATEGRNVMESSIECARKGVTTGEWAGTLREVFGEYRAPTGVGSSVSVYEDLPDVADIRARIELLTERMGRRPKILVGKPGLDGHSNGAEQIAVCARDCGFEVVYEGIRLTPARIAATALEEGVHVVGLSVLSGSHRPLVTEILKHLSEQGLADIPIVVGGIIPPEDAKAMEEEGVAQVFTPKDFDLAQIMSAIVGLVGQSQREMMDA